MANTGRERERESEGKTTLKFAAAVTGRTNEAIIRHGDVRRKS